MMTTASITLDTRLDKMLAKPDPLMRYKLDHAYVTQRTDNADGVFVTASDGAILVIVEQSGTVGATGALIPQAVLPTKRGGDDDLTFDGEEWRAATSGKYAAVAPLEPYANVSHMLPKWSDTDATVCLDAKKLHTLANALGSSQVILRLPPDGSPVVVTAVGGELSGFGLIMPCDGSAENRRKAYEPMRREYCDTFPEQTPPGCALEEA